MGTLREIARLTIHALVAATRTEISMLLAGILCSRKYEMSVNVLSTSCIIRTRTSQANLKNRKSDVAFKEIMQNSQSSETR